MGDAPAADNTPGSLVLPPWLLLLDVPDPRRVLVIGEVGEAVHAWFRQASASVRTLRAADLPGAMAASDRPEPMPELVVIGSGVTRELATEAGLGWLRSVAPGVAVVLPWRLCDKLVHRLRRAGYACIRSIDGTGESRRWRSAPSLGVVAIPTGPPARPPTWLVRAVEPVVGAAVAPAASWSLGAPGRYPSQKAVVQVRHPDTGELVAVVKVTRHRRFNGRLRNEHETLRRLEGLGGRVAGRVPAPSAVSEVGTVVALAQAAVPGAPLLERTSLSATCPLIDDARSTISVLAQATAHPVAGPALAAPLWDAHRLVVERHQPAPATADFLAAQVQAIEDAVEVPAVLSHGDLGCWNLFEHDGVAFLLDWESAEVSGPPLWDVYYLARSFAVRSGRRRGLTRRRAIDRHLLGSSRLNGVIAGWVDSSVQDLALPAELVEPLFHTCWLHRAAKEGARLAPDQPGHYGPLCLSLVDRRGAPGIRRLVQDDVAGRPRRAEAVR